MLDQIAVSGGLSVFLLEIENVSEDLALLNLILFFFFYFSQSRISPITFDMKSNPTRFLWPGVNAI